VNLTTPIKMSTKVKINRYNPENKTRMYASGGGYYHSTKPVIDDVQIWEGTEEEIFKRFDKANNRLRYCNGSGYKFDDSKMNDKYLAWYDSLDETTKLNLYYGNGVVD